MKKLFINIITVLILFTAAALEQGHSQTGKEQEVLVPYMEFKYLKNTDNQRILEAKVSLPGDLGLEPIEGLTVKFFTNMDNPVPMGEAITDSKGIAKYIIPDDYAIPVDEEGYWWFYAESEADDKYDISMAEVTVRDVTLDMALNEGEEGKKVILKAYTIVDGEKVPVSDEDIFVYVPRMFSLLPVAEGYFIDGVAEVEFPEDVPGDDEGNITVIGRFNDHWQYGNVEQRVATKWGIPASHEVAETHRTLWTQIAPRWMIVTLTIMLAGVWGHYVFAIISMVRIKRTTKKMK
ncbi:MAG: hypothetical protein K9J25_08640 [Bacteroidales bacterium]|nr:hypothetical protein [Bacteroidales bacterium]